MYKQKNNIIYIVHIHTIQHNYGIQLIHFSSINMDGAAEQRSSREDQRGDNST